MKYKVTAFAKERKTGKQISPLRGEIIDTKTNSLFVHCSNINDVKRKYESFWNDLNPCSLEIVKVVEVRPLKKSKIDFGGVF